MVFDANSILAYFKLASSEAILLEKWINGNDLCVTIGTMYNLRENSFTLKELTKALNTKAGKSIKYQIDVGVADPVTVDHIGIFDKCINRKLNQQKRDQVIFLLSILLKRRDLILLCTTIHGIII